MLSAAYGKVWHHWERARQGDGQLVMIVGEPGLGKSRLIEEFRTRLADAPHTWVEWSCCRRHKVLHSRKRCPKRRKGMKTQVHEYQGGDKTSVGYLAVPDGDGASPGFS